MPLSADAFLDGVRATLDEFSMLPESAPVLVAVSGGEDSVALAHALHALGVSLSIAHLDHGTRLGASAADAKFVEQLTKDLGVPYFGLHRDIESEAEDSPMSFEEFAREARYAFLIETAKAEDCGAIATGHHADDQAETVLMRVLRGTSPRGLAGIPPVTQRDGVPIVRPLFRTRRTEIIEYLHEGGHAHTHDESNEDTRFVRNRVRHDLLPLLQTEYNPRISEALGRLAETEREENALLDSLTVTFMAKCVSLDDSIRVREFSQGNVALRRRVLLELAWRHGAQPDFDRVDAAVDFIGDAQTGKRFDLGNGIQLRAGQEAVSFVSSRVVGLDTSSVDIAIPGDTTAFGCRVRVAALNALPDESLATYCTPMRQVINAACLSGGISARHRRPGDRIAPLGLGGSRKLKDYFCDLGIPPEERDAKLLICAGDAILWVVGHAVSEQAAIDEATRDVFEIEVTHAAE